MLAILDHLLHFADEPQSGRNSCLWLLIALDTACCVVQYTAVKTAINALL